MAKKPSIPLVPKVALVKRSPSKKVLTTEERILMEIRQKGSFKALPLKRSVLERSMATSETPSRMPTEFREFKLHTSNLESSKKAVERKKQIQQENQKKFEYVAFKATEVPKNLFSEENRQSVPPATSKKFEHLSTPLQNPRISLEPPAKKQRLGLE